MKISLKWLREYVDITLSPRELANRLTMAGTETEGMQCIGENWTGITIGEITGISPHPNADRLKLVTIDLGSEQTTVVCGAPNTSIGSKVAFAPVGAQLIDGHSGEAFRLKSAKIRGITSNGMACSEKELGISDSHEGIITLPDEAPIGTPLADYLGDVIYDLAITANRPDCLSVIGVAREVAALTEQQLHLPDTSYIEAGHPIEQQISVEITAPELCSRYCASLITGIRVTDSPRWLQQRLLKCGMRPISNIVDITNYVMLEYGQPLHAFDYDQIQGRKITVRRAAAGEKITTLDGLERSLSPDMLVIADQKRAAAIAGIMGGIDSEVTDGTSSVLLEAANFNPASIHRTGSALNMPSEACTRFERGIRPELVDEAIRKATKLIIELAGGQAARGLVDVYPNRQEQEPILLTNEKIRNLLGIDFSTNRIVAALNSLGFTCRTATNPSGVRATAPYWRSDIKQEVDLIEEVARIIGYDKIPTTLLGTTLPSQNPEPMVKLKQMIRCHLRGYGFQEIVTYSLTSLELLGKLLPASSIEPPPLRMANPMTAEQEYLRPNLRANLLTTLYSNRKHEDDSIRIFELGKVYLPRQNDLPDEPEILCALLSGPRQSRSWHEGDNPVDFYDAKGTVESLINHLVTNLDFEKSSDLSLHPNKQAAILIDGNKVGIVGEIHPVVREAFDICEPTYLIEFNVSTLLPFTTGHKMFRTIPRFPAVVRDIALIADRGISHRSIQSIIEDTDLVTKVTVFDVYSGGQIPAGKKSLAYRITFQSPDHTLTDDEVDKVQQQIIGKLSRELGATLRS
ncbi:MAG: phenylalanine--tRNA ligase subunit beta [Dehalococcoidales bacterium]|nr:phenylalanine--tRNA ligase subunit beta [Dehalococcoidales bacterium]